MTESKGVRKPRAVTLKSKLIGYLSTLDPTDQFNVYDLADEFSTTRGSINLYLQELVESGRIHIVRNQNGRTGKLHTYQTGKPKTLTPVIIPISQQSELWNAMFYWCSKPEPVELNWASIFQGINRWCDIVYAIWEARNRGGIGTSYGNSPIAGILTISYSPVKGGVSGNAA